MSEAGKFFSLCVYCFVFGIPVQADELAKTLAEDSAKSYVLAAEFGVPERLHRAILKVSSSPDSQLLFESTGEMVCLVTKNGRYDKLSWSPTILTDDRKPNTSHYPVMTDIESWEKIFLRGKEYVLSDGNAEEVNAVYSKDKWVPNGRCIGLFEWPMSHHSSFDRQSGGTDLPTTFFGEGANPRKFCFAASIEDADTVVSYWGVAQKSQVLAKAVFVKGLLRKWELLYFNDPFQASNALPDLSKGTRFSTVETNWTAFGNEDVPTSVECVFCPLPMESKESIRLSAKIEVKGKDSREFQKLQSLLDRQLDLITKK